MLVYDCDSPGAGVIINFNLNGGTLQTDYTVIPGFRLMGFFCENYSPSIPPAAIGLTQGLTAAPPGPVNPGTNVNLSMAAKNYGYRTSFPLLLNISGRPAITETTSAPLNVGVSRTLQGTALLQTPGSNDFASTCLVTDPMSGASAWKSLPPVDPGTTNFLGVQVLKPKDKEGKEGAKDHKDGKDGLEKLQKEFGHEVPGAPSFFTGGTQGAAAVMPPTSGQLPHFIQPGARVDLSQSALPGAPAGQKGLVKEVKEAKDFEKPREG